MICNITTPKILLKKEENKNPKNFILKSLRILVVVSLECSYPGQPQPDQTLGDWSALALIREKVLGNISFCYLKTGPSVYWTHLSACILSFLFSFFHLNACELQGKEGEKKMMRIHGCPNVTNNHSIFSGGII